MDIEADLYTCLTGDATLSALVSTRIFATIRQPGAEAPYVIFQKVGTDPATLHDGPAEITHDLYQFSCFASTYAVARAIRTALRNALDGVALASGDIPILTAERNDYDAAVDLHRADADFTI